MFFYDTELREDREREHIMLKVKVIDICRKCKIHGILNVKVSDYYNICVHVEFKKGGKMRYSRLRPY